MGGLNKQMVWNFKKIVKIGVEPNRRKRVNIDAYQTIKKY